MSNTRRSEPGKPMRQERYASSAEFNRGLLGNLVARRCSLLERPEDRQLIWFIQQLSHERGGLKALAAELLQKYSDRIGTASMLKFGSRRGQIYNAAQVRCVRQELPSHTAESFLLRGESLGDANLDELLARDDEAIARRALSRMDGESITDRKCAAQRPTAYPAKVFSDLCAKQCSVANLTEFLERFCLDPASAIECGPWYFDDLISCLRDHMADGIKSSEAGTVVTALGRKVCETLDFALETKRMVLIDGLPRMGKSFSAKAWCEQHPGCARYVQLPSPPDDIGFFRAIAKALGVSCGRAWKAVQLRQHIEETLACGDLVIVLDEAHHLWPNLIDSRSLPSKINWVLTGLVNAGVPVALITTPQFLKNQVVMETRTRWTSGQFTGRIGHYEKLPDSLSKADLANVARCVLPEGDAKSIEMLVCYAQGSEKYLAGIDLVVCRARFLAARTHRKEATRSDIKQAILQAVIPSDAALAQALAEPQAKGRGRRFNGPLTAPQSPISATEESDAQAVSEPIISDRNGPGVLDIRSRLRAPQAEPEPVTA
jgi:hypothetical protein